MIKGLYANLHREATRATPGNAPGERHHTLADPTARMGELIAEFDVRRVQDAEYWGKPEGTPITRGMKPARRDASGHRNGGPKQHAASKKPKGSKGGGKAEAKPPGWLAADPSEFEEYIREKYNLPDAKEDDAIRSNLPASQLGPVKAAAQAKAAQTKKAEPAIYRAVKSAVLARGGRLDREHTRLKGAGSMERKIADGVMEDKVALDEAAKKIRDSVRFTAVLPTDGYWAAGTKIADALAAAGYERVKTTPTWDRDRSYWGRNDTFEGADGVEFEVQFHTAESLAAARRNHRLYNIARKADTPLAAKAELNAEQLAYVTANVPIPNDLPN